MVLQRLNIYDSHTQHGLNILNEVQCTNKLRTVTTGNNKSVTSLNHSHQFIKKKNCLVKKKKKHHLLTI